MRCLACECCSQEGGTTSTNGPGSYVRILEKYIHLLLAQNRKITVTAILFKVGNLIVFSISLVYAF